MFDIKIIRDNPDWCGISGARKDTADIDEIIRLIRSAARKYGAERDAPCPQKAGNVS